jgi:hypothetical protein
MHSVKLIHWKSEEVAERENLLKVAGFAVDSNMEGGSKIFKDLAEDPPAAVVIDLSRLPSQGRDFALLIRKRKGSRHIPLVFVGGEHDKVERIKQLLPDACYTSWAEIGPTLERAIAYPPAEPVVHESTFAGYAGKPLVQKLGIKSGMTVCLVNSPPDFVQSLPKLPDNVKLHQEIIQVCDLTIWFCSSQENLQRHISDIVAQSQSGPVWIAWPKVKSALASDLTQQIVRQTGLDNNLVDYKISSFDDTWSGLLFTHREK